MSISFVAPDEFKRDVESWRPVGAVSAIEDASGDFVLTLRDAPLAIRLSVLSSTCLRVRFDPRPDAILNRKSHAVVDRPLPIKAKVVEHSERRLVGDAGRMRFEVDLPSCALRVYWNEQLICADDPARGLVFRPGQHGIASIKCRPAGAVYCGFGEKAGARLLKTGGMTNFNFDNFIYARAPIPARGEGGPLNPAEPLYASIPLLIEINRAPDGAHAGPPYCYGLFLDNVSQSYFDIGDANGADRYMFGARFGELDYYLFLGDRVSDIVDQFTRLTGRSTMPPAYAFGFHQGCYGYFDRAQLESVAQAYRDARIPLDGLHIDIDFQNNYRVFTHSEMKFPDAAGMLAGLRQQGIKCSTIVTPLITDNPLDERGETTPFEQRRELLEAGFLLHDVRTGGESRADPASTGGESGAGLFSAAVSYGADRGINPYRYPPLVPNRDGVTPLGGRMNYPDLGRPEVREAWARQYAHLVSEVGIDMIWQDMMCPAAAVSADTPDGTLPLDLMTHDGEAYVPHGVCHNAYAMFLLQATHAALRAQRPEVRPFILARGGYAGLQRYAALWSGDNASSWDFLRISIPQVLALGLSGVPISGSDVGGFATGPIPDGTTTASIVRDGQVIGGVTDPELFVRWMQAGAFLPWYRNHYIGYDKQYQEPYAYGEPVAGLCRTVVERRYRMLQVFYDAMYECTQTGMPIARAMFLNDPDDQTVYAHLDDQFFVGRDILVAPILFPAEAAGAPARREVYLPEGSAWFPLAEDAALPAPMAGGRTLSGVEAALDQVPVFVRAGAIVPLRSRPEQYVGELSYNPLEICVFPGPDSDYLLYQDDGISTRAETQAAFRTTRISHASVPGGHSVRLQRLHDGYAPAEPFFYIRLPAPAPPAAVLVGGNLVPTVEPHALELAEDDAYAFNTRLKVTIVKVFDRAADVTVVVSTSE